MWLPIQTRAARSFDFEFTRMISAQIALHSVQLPLWIIAPGLSFRIWLYLEISRFCCINTDIYDFSLHKVLTHFQALVFSKPIWSNKTNFKLSIKHFWRHASACLVPSLVHCVISVYLVFTSYIKNYDINFIQMTMLEITVPNLNTKPSNTKTSKCYICARACLVSG